MTRYPPPLPSPMLGAEPEHDARKKMGMKVSIAVTCSPDLHPTYLICCVCSFYQALILLTGVAFITWYWKRSRWTVLKNRKVVYYDKGS